jgi:cellulose synthase/poly-beta-1,6-N-acetylglucosamine synthase-like glycosyltransferase
MLETDTETAASFEGTTPVSTAAIASSSCAPRSCPRISVVVPAYNSERYLRETIDSVLAQTFKDWELVVFDDGSTDDTLQVARPYADTDRRITVAHGPNQGVANARNRGLALTDPRAEFVVFLDHDDLWEPDALELLVATLDAHPEYVATHGLCRCIDSDGELVAGDDLEARSRDRCGFRGRGLIRLRSGEPTTFGALVYQNCVITPGAALLRREMVIRIGGFDPATEPADDYDLTIRMSRYGDVGFVDRSVLRWRRHPETQSSTSRRWRAATLRIRVKTLTDPANTPDQFQATCLAHRSAVATSLRTAFDAARARQWNLAFRQVLFAAVLYQAYLCVRTNVATRRVASVAMGVRPLDH